MAQKNRTNTSGGVAQLLKISPMADLLRAGPVKLPEVTAPSLEGLAVHVPQLPDLTEDDILERFAEKARDLAKKRARAAGETLALGDDVKLNTVAYCEGKLMPFSARFGVWVPLLPIPMLPGFNENVARGTVGGSLQLDITLPAEYPVASLRGKNARFIVDVLEAREVTLPDMESTAVLKKAKLGDSLEAAMVSIREELEDEMVDALWVEAREMVLDAVAERTPMTIPAALIDEEVRRRWGTAEGQHLVAQKFDVDEQQEALDGWLKDPLTRAECERRLRIGLALKAVTEAEKLELTEKKLEELLSQQTRAFGLSTDEVREALRESPESAKALIEMGWYFLAVEHVLSKAKITFEGADKA